MDEQTRIKMAIGILMRALFDDVRKTKRWAKSESKHGKFTHELTKHNGAYPEPLFEHEADLMSEVLTEW